MTAPVLAAETFDCRVAFADELAAMAREDHRVIAVCNDSVGSSNLGGFQKEFPDRLVNVGIAEQDMVGIAAGLAQGGFIPFVCAAAPFLTGRALEQIKADVAYSGARVVLCGMSPGVSYGELGPTHHSIEDLSWLRAIDRLNIAVPADPDQTRAALRWAASAERGTYLRIGRFKVPSVTFAEPAFVPGKASRLADGESATIIANGVMVSRALDAADQLRAVGIGVRVLNLATLAPLDVEAIVAAARETGAIVTVEEATSRGGLGGAVAEVVVTHHPVPMRILGVTEFAPTGSMQFLLDHFGLSTQGIVAAVTELVDARR